MKKLILSALMIIFLFDALAQKQPEYFGRYIVQNDSLIELPPFNIKLSDMTFGDKILPVFTNLPINIKEINTINPTLIYYDQSVSTSTVRLSYIYMIANQDKSFSYSPMGTIPLKIKSLDKQGMFQFKPSESLATGLYAIYGGDVMGFQGSLSGNISIIKIVHPRGEEIYKTVNDFIYALGQKDYSTVANLSYTFENKKDYIPSNEDKAKTLKKSKIFSGKVIPVSILEMKDQDGTIFYKVFVISYGAFISLKIGNMVNLGDSYENYMFVSDKADGKLRVYTRPEEGGWMFTTKK